MARVWRIHDRSTFAALRRDGARRRSGPVSALRLTAPAGAGTRPRVAYAVGREVGTAAARNRLRRRLRAAVGEVTPAPGSHLLRAGPAASALPYPELRAHVAEVLG